MSRVWLLDGRSSMSKYSQEVPNLGKRQGKTSRKEIREKNLDPEMVRAARAKEWNGGWQHYSAVDVIPPKVVARLRQERGTAYRHQPAPDCSEDPADCVGKP